MALAIKCKTCSKISRMNYLNKNTARRIAREGKEFAACREAKHKLETEKVY